MKWPSQSVGSMVGGVVGALGLALAVLLSDGLINALDRSNAADRVAELATLDKAIFLTWQDYRLEKGQMLGALALSTESNNAMIEASLNNRAKVDGEMPLALSALGRLDLPAMASRRERLEHAYQDIKIARVEADAAMRRPLEARGQAIRNRLLSQSDHLLQSLNAVWVMLESEIQRLDPATRDLVRLKAVAWEARLAAADSVVILNEVLAAHRALTADELKSFRINDGRIETAWNLMRSVVEQPDTPVAVKAAFARAQADVFEGPLAARREALIADLSAGVDPHFTVEDLNQQLVPTLGMVGAVAVATMEAITQRADAVAASADHAVLWNALTLAVTVLLVSSGFVLITRRVTGPIRAMTAAMRSLANNEFSVTIPGTGRSDEIGAMALAVQVFKEGLIRNMILTGELERLATTDGMTGILNRRHFLVLADREWGRSRRYQRLMSMLMIDIDFFKSINDRFGHDTGDQIIIRLAQVAAACKRDSDLLARIGGEEFALLLPETNIEQAVIVGERLRREMAAQTLAIGDRTLSATISIGVAPASAHHQDISDLMREADQALYQAKDAGRNRVVRSTGAPVAAARSPAIVLDSPESHPDVSASDAVASAEA